MDEGLILVRILSCDSEHGVRDSMFEGLSIEGALLYFFGALMALMFVSTAWCKASARGHLKRLTP